MISKIMTEVNESINPRIESIENKTKVLETELSNKVYIARIYTP